MSKGILRFFKSSFRIGWLGLLALVLTDPPGTFASDEIIHYQQLVSFGAITNDGWQPWCPLIEGSDGFLYGTTYHGGSNNCGVVFRLNKNGHDYRLLHHFGNTPGDGQNPVSGLIEASNGFLYGTTEAGGSQGSGTIFRILPDGSSYSVIHTLVSSEGTAPEAALIEGRDGVLYGTAANGGADAWSGTVFAINKDGSNFHVLHRFGPSSTSDGIQPWSSLLEGSDGALYGTTVTGGGSGVGSVFKLNEDGSGYTKLHAFGFNDPVINPSAALLEGNNHALYGTAYGYLGGVFKINQDGTGYQVLVKFNGAQPYGAMTRGRDGALYGTTFEGGKQGNIFKLNEDGSNYQVVYSFGNSPSDGQRPHAGLLLANDGAFYGTTFSGGESNRGTVFRLLANHAPVVRCTNVIVSATSNCSAFASIDNGSFDPDGDIMTLVQMPPGPYPLGTNPVTLTATDSCGDSNSGTGLVIVLDTTPPELDCPSNIVVEFASEAGAVVNFSPLATDTCDPNPIVNCRPASGSVFPIGTTEVHCTASDMSGNMATCHFNVTVVGARGVKQNVLSALIALKATVNCDNSRSNGKEGKPRITPNLLDQHTHIKICNQLDAAIVHLRASLNPSAWLDETHLERKAGRQVFLEEKLAMDEMCKMLQEKGDRISKTLLQEMISRIMRADHLLASIAIRDATAAGDSLRKISQAEKFIAKGDTDWRNFKYSQGIEDYEQAWAHTLYSAAFSTIHIPHGHAQLKIQYVPGERCVIQASSNLVNWTTIGTGIADTNGIVTFEDSSSEKYPLRYYRAVTQ